MLRRLEKIRTELDSFFALLKTPAGTAEFSDAVLTVTPSSEDWFYIRCLGTLLEPFAEVTKRLGGEIYPTFILVFPYLRMMKEFLQSSELFDKDLTTVASEPFADDARFDMSQVREVLLWLFTQRFRAMDEKMMWVPLLDPRLADMTYLESHEEDRARDSLVEAMIELGERPSLVAVAPQDIPPSFYSPQRVQPSVMDRFDARLYGRKKEPQYAVDGDRSQQFRTACKAEAFSYLTMVQQNKPTEQPLHRWRDNGFRFPVLRQLARKWLGCVATSVSSERAFSNVGNVGNVVTMKRAALTVDMVERLTMLAQNWKEVENAS